MRHDEQEQLEHDRQKLIELLESGRVEVQLYLVSNPYSDIKNYSLDGIITELLFYKEFFVLSYKHYERIAQIFDVAESINKHSVFISGFLGTGKTSFVNYLKRLINKEENLPKINENDFKLFNDPKLFNPQDLPKFIESLNSLLGPKLKRDKIDPDIVQDIDKSFEKKRNDNDFLKKLFNQINVYIEHLNNNFSGKAVCLNFEYESNDLNDPILHKLLINLKKRIYKIINEGENVRKTVGAILGQTISAFGPTFLDGKDGSYMKKFRNFINDNFISAKTYEEIENSLNEALKDLKIDQILSLLLLQDLSYMKFHGSNRKLFYIFDNLDAIFDNTILDNFVRQYTLFHSDISKLLRDQPVKKIIFEDGHSFHSDVCFIFNMRETSQMHIADHLRNSLEDASIFFDMSGDVDKSIIVNKKNMFLEDHNNNNAMEYLLKDTKRINDIISDYYFKNKFISMFNNDYIKIIKCLALICRSNRKQIDEYLEIWRRDIVIESQHLSEEIDTRKQGTRGILFRLIFDHFKSQGYFNYIRLAQERRQMVNYTPARLILLYLNRKQYYPPEKSLVDVQDKISLTNLYDDLERALFQNQDPVKEFSVVLGGMFNLRNALTWAHLITFDSIKSISPESIQTSLKEGNAYINVRITDAGRNFLRFMTSHFEFYSCRFCNDSKPLFSPENEEFDEKRNKYKFERILGKICKIITQFCENMNEFIKEWQKKYQDVPTENIYQLNDFLYENNIKDKSYELFHEERYIHQHISYIDAYRMYLINPSRGKPLEYVIDINKRILRIEKEYIDLLNKYDYYSRYSRRLYNNFMKCYDYIVKEEYKCTDVEISTPSYIKLKKQEELVKAGKGKPIV
jgi:hypothetical protein